MALYSDPVLSEAETLSWVILGRASAASGGEAILMQQAALALLGGLGKGSSGGSLASRFGLDEIGFKGPGSETAEGSATTGGETQTTTGDMGCTTVDATETLGDTSDSGQTTSGSSETGSRKMARASTFG